MNIFKRRSHKQITAAGRKKVGYHQFPRWFNGVKFHYHSFVPDSKHQGPRAGESGSVEWLRGVARSVGQKIRTVRKAAGWEIYYK